MADGAVGGAPMPLPLSLYQGPTPSLPSPAISASTRVFDALCGGGLGWGSMPAACQRSSSAICVPDRSPREMNGAAFAWMVLNAAVTSVMPLTPAGSLLGPTRMKSLYITG